jgi:hypothetical protein
MSARSGEAWKCADQLQIKLQFCQERLVSAAGSFSSSTP